MAMMPQFAKMTSLTNFLMLSCFFFVNFSYWFKFHVNIITGSGVMAIFLYKGLARNPETWNTLVWVLPNIWRLGQVRDTKFGTNVSNEMLLNNVNLVLFLNFSTLPSAFSIRWGQLRISSQLLTLATSVK